jgi:TldD protein
MRGDRRLVHTEASSIAIRTNIAFASSEGLAITQQRTECGGGIAAHAAADGELQTRSYPNAHGGSVALAGYEHLRSLALEAHAPRVAEEAVALLSAPPCPAGRTTLVLGDEQLALQIHESIGHALELDRMLLGETSYAGTSWVSPSDLGTLRFGSPLLRVDADATLGGGLGSFGWDDEGVEAQRVVLIDEGVLRGTLSDRVSAAALGAGSIGAARADGFARQPIVRMTNVSIQPGEADGLEELLDGVREGIYMETNRSWSIDDQRLHFQFGTEIGREIRDGRLGRLLRNPTYAGVSPRFWGSLDALADARSWRLWGLMNCGKGEPGQEAHVSHGAAPARFRDVEVGVLG